MRAASGVRDNPAALAPRQFIFAHAALADPTLGRLRHDQRGGAPRSASRARTRAPRDVWIDDWRLALEGNRYEAVVHGRDFGYRLTFTASGPPLLQGEARLLSARARRPARRATTTAVRISRSPATIERDGRREAVTGAAWLDHEWSSQYMAGDAVGWDWTGLNLDGGGALMAFVMRARDGTLRWGGATLMAPDRTVRTFGPSAVRFTPLRTWTLAAHRRRVSGGDARRGRRPDFDLAPLLDDQELDSRSSTGTIYWEGAVRAAENGKPAGRGYLELTGYWKPQRV